MIAAVWQFVQAYPLYVLWVIGTGALCLWLALQHTGEEDYLDDEDDSDLR